MQVLLYLEDEAPFARALAQAAGLTPLAIACHRFPDGELRLRLPAALPRRVVLLRGLRQPNEKLTELLLAARTARELGARHLTLVAPYLPYMRQDMAFVPGEAVSQRIVGSFLAGLFDALLTVDPHLHRVSALQDVVPVAEVRVLSAAPLLGDWIAGRLRQPLLLGPDGESRAWVERAAAAHGFEHAVCRKQRQGDRQVQLALPGVDVRGRACVLVDDVASSGRTLAEAARRLLQTGAASVDVAITHALLADDAIAVMQAAGIRHLWSTDAIAHPSNVVSLVPLLAAALR